jgi:hypothetical protein
MVYTCSENAQIDGMLVLDLINQMTENTKPATVEAAVVTTKEFEIRSEELLKEEFEEDFCDEDYQPARSGIKKHNIGKKDLGGKAQILFSFLFFALLAAMVFIRMNFILSDEENILSIIVMLVSTVTGIVAFLSGIKDYSAGSKKLFSKAEKEDMEAYNEIGDTDGFDDSDISDAKEYSFGAADNSWDTFEDHEENIDITTYKRPISISSGLRASDETVVLDMDEDCDREVTLYSRNTDKTLRICLSKLPLTIGKLEGCVDNVISDKSISRIHCRFSRNEEGRIVLTDLNSTNGTFKNGLRLKAQEENYIEEGDEIRIGRICFDCR